MIDTRRLVECDEFTLHRDGVSFYSHPERKAVIWWCTNKEDIEYIKRAVYFYEDHVDILQKMKWIVENSPVKASK